MTRRSTVTPEKRDLLLAARERGESMRSAARSAGVSYGAARRSVDTAFKQRVRTEDEFTQTVPLRAPLKHLPALFSWSLEMIREARDAQMLGYFRLPVLLARAMRTDDAIFTAYHNRIAPQSSIEALLVPAAGARGDRVKTRAASSCIIPRNTLAGINGTLANHGVAIGYNEQQVSDDGGRIDFKLTEWPLEFIRWDRAHECFRARTRWGGSEEFVTHGDGRWIVFRKFDEEPWTQEACVLPAAILWYAHMSGIRDWALASTSHGQAKIVGQLPSGVTLQSKDGVLTAEAQAILNMLQDIVSGESGAAIAPNGTEVDFLSNGSTAWQVFKELIENREKAAARIYQGTDATLGAQGGAPGVDIAALFNVATTKIQGDFRALEDGLRTGMFEPWCAMNYGDSTYAPSLVYQLPDRDADEQVDQIDKRRQAFFAQIERMRANGMATTQDDVNALAKEYRITAPRVISIPLDLGQKLGPLVVRVNDALQSQGLAPLPPNDPRGDLTIAELQGGSQGKPNAAADPAAAEPPAGAPPAASAFATRHIVHEGGKWILYTEDGSKKLGEYDTKEEAVARERQVKGHAEDEK